MIFQLIIAFFILIITIIFSWDDESSAIKKRIYIEDIIPDEKAYQYMWVAGPLSSKVEQRFLKMHAGSVSHGGGCLSSGVEEVDFGFFLNCEPTIEATREALIDLYEIFCEVYNSNEKVRPYLTNYPFGTKNTRLKIYPLDTEAREIYNGKDVWVAASYDEIFVYKSLTPTPGSYRILFSETIEEARAIVEAQRKGEKNVN